MSQPGPKVKRSRALGIPLTPKAAKYMDKRPYPPGQHGRNRPGKASDYKIRLMEKQRLRDQYNINERQMRRAFDEATRKPGKTGEILVSLLERRLDAFVLRSGFARTIYQARQFVSHQHFQVNGQRVNIPSYRLKPGDFVQVVPASRQKPPFMYAMTGGWAGDGQTPKYIEAHLEGLISRLVDYPQRADIPVICEEQLVVEYYSR
ncbi:30S ribosomal protein S4 [Natronoglycomyces albus]|uniref:Small ribosomal subunit protein uS4 n=1 Tax=Natronoglycomyces albus TaxID=2811108 RepID=A0A895XRF9_9ACTN|nr:30S ribosomal protein S4 [Natronoglycomyces albus]QSB06113.1 30S ribosomal protein S4 [Natronoglycomyces albus]